MKYVVTRGTRYKQTRNVTAREAKYPWAEMAAPDGDNLSQFFVPGITRKKIQGNAYQTGKKLTEKRNDGITVKFALRNVIQVEERPVMLDQTNEDGTITQVIATNEDGTPKMEQYEVKGVLCQRVS